MQYLEAPLRRPMLTVAPVVLVAITAVAGSFLLAPRYRSTTLLHVRRDDVPEAIRRRESTESADKRVQALRQQLLDRQLVERALHGSSDHEPAEGERPPALGEQVDVARAATEIRVQGDEVLRVTYAHHKADEAARFLNRLVSLLVEDAESKHRVRAEAERLEAALVEARQALVAKEAAVKRLREPHLDGPAVETAPEPVTLSPTTTETAAMADALARAAELRRLVEAEDQEQAQVPSRHSAELTELRGRLVALRQRYTDEHPDVEALVRRIRRLEAAAAAPSRGESAEAAPSPARVALGETEAEIARLEQKQATLEAASAARAPVDRRGKPLRRDDAVRRATSDLGRERESYREALEKWQVAETERGLLAGRGDRFEVVAPARVPEAPFSPNRPLFAFFGLALGLALGLGAAVVAEFRDRSIRGPEDLEETLALPIIAVIPRVRGGRRRRGAGAAGRSD